MNALSKFYARSDSTEAAPLIEPVIVSTTFITGLQLHKIHEEVVQITAWERLMDSDGTEQRRIVARLAMSNTLARLLLEHLRVNLGTPVDSVLQ